MTVRKAPDTIISIHPASIGLLELLGGDKSYRDTLSLLKTKSVRTAFPWSDEAEPGSVALHHIYSTVFYDSWWGFSTRDFVDNLLMAEDRPEFVAHLLVVDSPGGEIFYCHEAAAAIRKCRKPVIAVCEEMCASAAYWIASAADKVYAVSPFSEVGSIGVMARFVDGREWYRSNGFKEIEVYATGSDLKNKVYNDAVDGKPEELALYEALEARIFSEIENVRLKVSKSQISFYNRHLFACVSFLRVKRKAELPGHYIVLTLGLDRPLESPRAAVVTEPYPGRWTHHFVLSRKEEIDGELMDWVKQAAVFAAVK